MKKSYFLFIWMICYQGFSQSKDWQPLFDGKALNGWTTYLGIPHQSFEVPNLKKDDKGKFTQTLGKNNDPLKVFSVVIEDNKPAIFVTGQVFGTLTFDQDFENYHVKVDFKWGKKKWQPRLDQPRDAGLLYHGFGDAGVSEKNWHPAQECQIQEGDVGDYWPTGLVTMDIPSVKTDTSKWWVYKQGAPLQTKVYSNEMAERRVLKYPNNEKPSGQWNTVEVICWGDSSIHIVNGKVVMRLYHSRKIENGKPVPLTKGTIALQSEGAELFYRNVLIKPLKSKPKIF